MRIACGWGAGELCVSNLLRVIQLRWSLQESEGGKGLRPSSPSILSPTLFLLENVPNHISRTLTGEEMTTYIFSLPPVDGISQPVGMGESGRKTGLAAEGREAQAQLPSLFSCLFFDLQEA